MNNIQNILNEIYAVDPDLKAYESELVRIIQEIINKRPDTKFDEAFARELRTEVLERARELNLTQVEPTAKPRTFFAMVPSWSYAVAGAALTLVIVLPLVLQNKSVEDTADSMRISFNTGVSKVAGNAFGSLSGGEAANNEAMGAPQGLGAGGDGVGIQSLEADSTEEKAAGEPAPMAIGLGGGADARMIMPNPFSYEFEYTGDSLKLGESTADVYRRVSSESASRNLAAIIGNMDLGLINLGILENLSLQSLSLNQNKEFGLTLNYNADEGSFSLYKNWQMWPDPNKDCRDEDCYRRNRLNINDVPGDQSLVEIANGFLSGLGVDRSKYGEPVVEDSWRKSYERTENKEDAWVPEEVQVIYPLILEGQAVYEYGGRPHGMTVTVDIRNRRGAGLYNLYPYNYQASQYRMVTDFSRIVKLAEQGGDRPYYIMEGGSEVKLELGTPEMVLMQYHSYDEEQGRSQALFLPALQFPIINTEAAGNYYGQDVILIPLAEEIVAEWEERFRELEDRPDMPMPLLRDEPISVPAPARDVDIMSETAPAIEEEMRE